MNSKISTIAVLDTDVLTYFLKGHTNVVKRMSSVAQDQVATTIINHTELLFGAFNSIHQKKNLDQIQSFLNQLKILHKLCYIYFNRNSLL